MARVPTYAPLHITLMRALNTYRLLTYDTMLRLGLATNQKALGIAVSYLETHKLIDHRNAEKVGKTMLPNVFWLTPRGAADLFDMDPTTKATGGDLTSDDDRELRHRLGLVRLHIALREWAARDGIEVQSVTCDFSRGARGLGKATTLKNRDFMLAPDLVAWLRVPSVTNPQLLVLEFERGGARGDLTVFFKADRRRGKLRRLREASEARAIEDVYRAHGHTIDPRDRPRFLVVFGSHATRMDRATGERRKHELHRDALGRWPDQTAGVWNWFFVQDEDAAAADFGGEWHRPGRAARPLFLGPASPSA